MNADELLAAWKNANERSLKLCEIADYRAQITETQALAAEWKRIFDQLLQIAETSGPDVWLCIASAYQLRRGTDKNPAEAKRWFLRAAEAGSTAGMVRLGLLLKHPESPETHTAAVGWFRKAASLGSASGMVWMGFACREGCGIPENHEEAARWFIRAYEAGDTHAAVHAGSVYSGYMKRPELGLPWYLLAAEAGHTDSHIELAMLYDTPGSPCHNAAEAVKWFTKVAAENRGSTARAMIALARHSRDGDGMPQSKEVAMRWLHKVMERTDPKSSWFREAETLLQEIEGSLL